MTPPPRTAHLPLAEVALAAVSVAVVLGFARIFDSWAFFWPLLAIVVATHLITMVLRRRGVGLALSALAVAVVWVLLVAWLWFLDTTAFGLPTLTTWRAARFDLSASWEAFHSITAPAPVQTGFLLAAAFALVFAVFLADWAAFRLWSPIEAIVPTTTLFVFCTLLAADRQRVGATLAFIASVLVFLLAHRVARLEGGPGWLTAEVGRGSRAMLRTGAALCALAVAGGVVVGPRLPGAHDTALIEWRGDQRGPGSRVTISPLVDIRSRLVDQGDTVVFKVQSPQRAYWRLTALDTFDGQIWRSGGKYAEVGQALPDTLPPGVAATDLPQQYTIENLSALWLPAAFEPVAVDRGGTSMRYQPESSTLIVDTGLSTSDGLAYDVTSRLPRYTATELRSATTADVPAEIADRYLALPPDFSRRAARDARRFTAGADTPYDQALALQDWFHNNFSYDLTVPSGHSESAIDDFLDRQSGYCEQFAGTFAAMARSLGIPARVAVGFTWGDEEIAADGTSTFTVRGKHAHAWPEVYLAGFGWVAFEPTPDRGAPGAESYTGLPAAQDLSSGLSGSTTTTSTTAPATGPSTTLPAGQTSPDEMGNLFADQAGGSTPTSPRSPWPLRLTVAGLVLFGLVLAYAVAVPAAVSARRRRRHERAVEAGPSARVQVAWVESVEELELVGAVRSPQETHDEFAARIGTRLPTEADRLAQLARDTDAATFAPEHLEPVVADRAEATAAHLAGVLTEQVSRHRRILRRLDPRPLWTGHRLQPRHEARRGG